MGKIQHMSQRRDFILFSKHTQQSVTYRDVAITHVLQVFQLPVSQWNKNEPLRQVGSDDGIKVRKRVIILLISRVQTEP